MSPTNPKTDPTTRRFVRTSVPRGIAESVVGFDAAPIVLRIEAWLEKEGFAVGGRGPRAWRRATGDALLSRKARGALAVLESIADMKALAPEMHAETEWASVIAETLPEIERLVVSARRRGADMQRHADRAHGAGADRLDRRARDVTGIAELAAQLRSRLHALHGDGDAERRGRPGAPFLGRLIDALNNAGFTYREVARFVEGAASSQAIDRVRHRRNSVPIEGGFPIASADESAPPQQVTVTIVDEWRPIREKSTDEDAALLKAAVRAARPTRAR